MTKYYLIYTYHDIFIDEFNTFYECTEFVKHLKIKYGSDFHYQIIKGYEVERG